MAVDQIRASIREFGFAVPILAKSDGEVIDRRNTDLVPRQSG